MTPEDVTFWKWLIGGAVAAAGGGTGVVKSVRAGAHWLQRRVETKKRVAVIRNDNEAFKSEVRAGLKVLQQGIQRLDATLRAQANLDPRPMFFALPNGKVNFVNREFTRLLGWTIEDMQDEGIVNAFHGSDRRRVEAEWGDAVRARRNFITGVQLQHADPQHGMPRPARLEALVMRCADGSIYGWQGIVHVEPDQAPS